MEMKNQLAQLMEKLKEKDNLISQNNQKIGNNLKPENNNAFNNNAFNNNGANMQNNQMMNPQQFNNGLNYNTQNNINQIGGLNSYMQYTGTNPFAQQQNNMMFYNNLNNNRMGFNSQPPKKISSVL